jgi:thiaminase/transcriptional activator TenA
MPEIRMQPTTDFASYCRAGLGQGFCEWLRYSSGPLWEAMVDHRFTRDMAADRLPPEAFVRYLRYEHAFVRSAVEIFARALILAPTVDDRAHMVAILAGLSGEQEDYFQSRFKAMGLSPEPLPDRELPDLALALSEGALAIAARGTFEEILSTMLAAEWMYHHWCTAAHAARPRQDGPAEWIALHVAPGFADQVAWAKGRVDALGPRLDPARQVRCADSFARMLRLEIAFHHTPYESSGSSGTSV